MDGEISEGMPQALAFLKQLTGREGDKIDDFHLTSAQRLRFKSWCLKNDFSLEGASQQDFITEIVMPQITKQAIGLDVQDMRELFPDEVEDLKTDSFVSFAFSQREIAYAEMHESPLQTLTGVFALKEAICKADNRRFPLESIEIDYDNYGRPVFDGFAVSVSHSGSLSIATALALVNSSQHDDLPKQFTDYSDAPEKRSDFSGWLLWSSLILVTVTVSVLTTGIILLVLP